MIVHVVEFWFSCGDFCLRNAKVQARILDRVTQRTTAPLDVLLQASDDVRTVYAVEPAHSLRPDERAAHFQILPNAIRYVACRPYERRYIDLDGSFDEYLKGLRGKTRQIWKRKVAKFADASGGRAEWKRYSGPDEMAEFQRLACEVAAKTYQHKRYKSGLNPSDAFRRELERHAAADQVRGSILFWQGRPIAYQYGYGAGAALFCSKLGYDPAFAKSSPGTVLFYLTLQALFEEGRFRWFDFGRGEFAYKEHLCTESHQCSDVFYFRRNLRNLTFVIAHLALQRGSNAVGDALAVVGLKASAKKFLTIWSHRRHDIPPAETARMGDVANSGRFS